MAKRRVIDSEGNEVRAGDCVWFSFGIPPVAVCAHVIERDGRLIVLTPHHNPKEASARSLREYVDWFSVEPCRCADIYKHSLQKERRADG